MNLKLAEQLFRPFVSYR